MSAILQNWQGETLILPDSLRLSDCEAIDWDKVTFPGKSVVIDASHIHAVDSIGIAALVLLLRKAYEQKITVKWIGLGQQLRNMLAVYELDNGAFLSCRNN